jgi:Endosomal/lysosomal potassium channel TMEM175
MGKARLEAFSDGVIAVIITIMVLEMKVPRGAQLSDLLELAPVFFSYGGSVCHGDRAHVRCDLACARDLPAGRSDVADSGPAHREAVRDRTPDCRTGGVRFGLIPSVMPSMRRALLAPLV